MGESRMRTNVRTQRILGMLIAVAKYDVGMIQDIHPAIVDDRTGSQLAQDEDYVMAQVLFKKMMNRLLDQNNNRYSGSNFFSIDEIDQEIEAMRGE